MNNKISNIIDKILHTVRMNYFALILLIMLIILINSLFKYTNNDVIYDIHIGITSGIILALLIDYTSKRIERKRSKNHDNIIISQIYELLQIYIREYIKSYYCVITPIDNRNNVDTNNFKTFTIRDMRDMFKITTYLKEWTTTSIEYFLKSEFELRNQIEIILRHQEIKNNCGIYNILIKFLDESVSSDQRNIINGILSSNLKESIDELMKNDPDKTANDIITGIESSSNIISVYIILQKMMINEWKILLDFENEIKKLNCCTNYNS